MAKSKKDDAVKRRPPHTLSKNHLARLKKSDEARANNWLRVGPGAAKKPADDKAKAKGGK